MSTVEAFQLATRLHGLPRRDISFTHAPMPMPAPPTSGAGFEAAYLDVLGEAVTHEGVVGTIELGHASVTAPTWLDDIYSLVAKSLPDDAVDILYQRFDEMFSRSEFEACDGVLRAIDLSRLDTNLLVAVLSITRPASSKLDARKETLRDVERELRKRVPERAERLLSGLR